MLDSARPLLMGILNATPDSFSDPGRYTTLSKQLQRAQEMLDEGANIIDIGGESAVSDRPAISPEEEIARVCPLIERVSELGVTVSIDTYKPAVARAAIACGATIVNDISGLRDRDLAMVCAQSGAALVIMHTRVAPKRKLLTYPYDDVGEDVVEFLAERMQLAMSMGMEAEQIILDPGPDFAKNPAQTIAALQSLEQVHELERPLLLAVSRKDFIGALTHTKPSARLAGTLAALGFGVDQGVHIMRVHDVKAAADFLTVNAVLKGEHPIAQELMLDHQLRREKCYVR
jgi:dihydropteroate synthase